MMKRFATLSIFISAITVSAISWAGPHSPGAANTSAPDARIRRGDYITHRLAMCVQCHSPRDEGGTIIETQEFTGAPVPIHPPQWASTWATAAVNIRGLRGWNEDEAVHFFQTGQRFNGARPMSPMPPFRMSLEDAQAVVAYLKSLQ